MKCAKCGKKLRSNEKFCTNCGYYNDGNENDTWKEPVQDEDLIDENWYEDEVEANTKDDDEEIIVPEEKKKKEKKKKEKKKKEKKKKELEKVEIKEEQPVQVEVPPVPPVPIEEEVVVKKEKEEKKQKELIKEDKSNDYYYENERYLEAYIGEDYKIIKKSPFNIWAFLLNWMYFLYRKLFITGIIGLIITTLVAFFLTKYFLIYLVVMLIVLGFGFNPYYIFISKKKVEKLLKEYEGSDSFTLENECRAMGGVNIIFSLIIYAIFLVIIVLSITGFKINTDHNAKYWKENSENKANCLSLTKLAYNQEKTKYNSIDEAICKLNNKEYTIYLKAVKGSEIIYIYYETENDYIVYKNNTSIIPQLEERKKNNNISVNDEKLLSDLKLVKTDYSSSVRKANEEDKLIKNKRNKEEKHYFIISYEELIR